MKKLFALLLSAMMLVSLAACGNAGSNGGQNGNSNGNAVTGGTYIIPSDAEPSTLNPDAISDDYNYPIVQNLFPRLFKLNNAYQAIPDLATSYDVSDDALTYTFHLRENAVWSDGEKVTAADVLYTFNEIIQNNYAFSSVFQFVDAIETPDDYTVVFRMNAPDGSFVSNLSWYGTFILPEHVLKGTDWLTNDDFSNNPVTCGPFKFDAWNKGTDVQIVRDDNYWGEQKAYLDRVIYTVISDGSTMYQAWLKGEIDEIGAFYIPTTDLPGIIADTDHYYTVEQVWPSPWYIAFNLKTGHFADALVREAIAYGVDREDVSIKATGGYKPANNHFIPDNYVDALNEDAKEPDYDVAKAQALLEQAGYTKDANGYYFETTFTVMSGFDDFCKVIADHMEKMGIKVTLDVLDFDIWAEKVMDNYDFEITALGGFQGPDVLGTARRWTTAGSTNIPQYSRKEVDDLAAKAVAAATDAERNDCIKQIQTYLREDMPQILIVNYADVQPFNNYIKGNPYVSVKDGGSLELVGFSELTYVWLDQH